MEDAAREITDAAKSLPSLLPKRRVTRSDTTISHLLTDGELSRIENASKFGGMSGGSQMLYGATLGIAVPFVSVLIAIIQKGLANLSGSEAATAVIGVGLLGASIREWCARSSIETVTKVCAEFRKRPQSDIE